MEVFLTGSTGLLGANLARELLDAGHGVRALARDGGKAARVLPGSTRLRIVVGDLEGIEGWADALPGCDAVVNAGAYFRESFGAGDHEGPLQRINVDAAVALYRAARAAGVPRFVQVSTDGVLAPRPDGAPSREEDAPGGRMAVNPYMTSKWRAEEALRTEARPGGPRLTLARPGWMFGPHDGAPTTAGEMVARLVAGKGVQLIEGTPMGVVDVRDVARGIRLAVEAESPPEALNLTGLPMTALDALRAIAGAAGRGAGRVQAIPFPVAMALSRLLAFPTSLLGIANPIPTVGLLTLRRGVVGDTARARALGVVFRPFAETARDAASWFSSGHEGYSSGSEISPNTVR